MAMNKKERDEMEALRLERDMYRAMYISTPVKPDIYPPAAGEGYATGWFPVIVYGFPAAREGVMAYGKHRYSESEVWSNGTPPMYSTRSAALRAARHDISTGYARSLANVDREIEQAEQEEQNA